MKHRKQANNNRANRIAFRLNDEEYQEFSINANFSGLNKSEFIRRCVLGKRIHSAIDLKMINELRKIGGLVKHIHKETDGLYKHKTASILDELRATIAYISQHRKGGA